MPKAVKKTVSKRKTSQRKIKEVLPEPEIFVEKKNPVFGKLAIVGLLLLVLAFVVWRNKGLFVAATVNGQPLWRLSLEKQLVSRYGNSTLDEMVGEMLIRQAAGSKKVAVSKAEIDAKLTDIEKSLNGQISLKDALAQQGDTVEAFRQRIELQLLLEKLTAGQVTIGDQEINDYIDKNKATLTATDESGMRDEAKKALISQKQNTVLRQYFTDLQSKAKVSKFL